MDEHQAIAIGSQVRRARKAHDWTQGQLATEAGVAPGTVVSVELGKNVRPGSLRSVLDALNIPPISDAPKTVDNGVKLALDLVEKWLAAMPESRRLAATEALIRFTVLGDWTSNDST